MFVCMLESEKGIVDSVVVFDESRSQQEIDSYKDSDGAREQKRLAGVKLRIFKYARNLSLNLWIASPLLVCLSGLHIWIIW